jgi:hypothetical protein
MGSGANIVKKFLYLVRCSPLAFYLKNIIIIKKLLPDFV